MKVERYFVLHSRSFFASGAACYNAGRAPHAIGVDSMCSSARSNPADRVSFFLLFPLLVISAFTIINLFAYAFHGVFMPSV
jgi:hypothetical protein